MPQIDLVLEKLEKYQGCSPCPSDFDVYWEDALLEMIDVDSQIELIKSDFKAPQAECFDLYFTGVLGARIHAKYLRPKNITKPGPAVLLFHGYGDSSGFWYDKLAFVSSGFCVAAMDCRGQAGISEDVGGVKGNTFNGHIIRGLDSNCPQDLLIRHLYLDTVQLARIIMGFEEVDDTRVAAMGGSQGGGLALACGSLEPRINRLAVLQPFLCDYKRVWDLGLTNSAYMEIRDYFRRYDPTHIRINEIFYKLGYIDVQNLCKRIQGKVLMVTGLMDTTCPPSTQFAAYNKIISEKSINIYPDHEHFAFQYIPEATPKIYDDVYQFLLKC